MFPFTIRQLEIFLDLCESCSFRQTADHFRISQPSVSSQIAALEFQLGQGLFERRRGRQPQLTAAGHQFRTDARRFLDLGREMAGRYRLERPIAVQDVQVYVGGHLLNDFVKHLLPDFERAHPHLRLHLLLERPRPQLRRDIARDRIDIALFSEPPWTEPSGEVVGKIRAGVFGHPSLAGSRNDASAISALPFVQYRNALDWGREVTSPLVEAGVVPSHIMAIAPDHEVMRRMLMERKCAAYSLFSVFTAPPFDQVRMLLELKSWNLCFHASPRLSAELAESFRAFLLGAVRAAVIPAG